MLEKVEKGLMMQKPNFCSEGWAEGNCTSKASETVLFICKVTFLMHPSKPPSMEFTVAVATVYSDNQPYAQK